MIRDITRELLRYFDFGVYADCDELISLDRFDETTLQAQPEIYVAGFDVFWRGSGASRKLFGLINPAECKPLIFSRTPMWSLGFHGSASGVPGRVLSIPMAHVRFLYKEEGSARLVKRRDTHQQMNLQERKNNVACSWATGAVALEEFYAHVDRLSEQQMSSETFVTVDPTSIFTLAKQRLPDGQEVVVPVAKSVDWSLMADRYWNLSDHFSRLMDRKSAPSSFTPIKVGPMSWKWTLQ